MPVPANPPAPRFVNMQNRPVGVYNEAKKHIYVLPYSGNGRNQGIYIVEGEWYKQFVAPAGPLVPFPGTAAPIAPPVPVPVPKPADVPFKPLADEVGSDEKADATSGGDNPVGVVAGDAESDSVSDKVADDVPAASEAEPEPEPTRKHKPKPRKHS